MQCAVCNANVENFHLKSFNAKETAPRAAKTDVTDGLLPSAFDINPFLVPTNPAIPRSSTPVGFTGSATRGKDLLVLRIDNVPWVCLSWTVYCLMFTQIIGHYSTHDCQLVEAARCLCPCLTR